MLLTANVLHVLAAGAWIGGLAVLVLALPAATRRLEGAERTRLLAGAIGRFSTVALVSVAVLLLGGVLQSLLELSAVDDLWDTAFGRAIAIKALLVVALLALGALNRRRTVPGLRRAAAEGATPGRAGVLLRRTLRAEVALGAVALGRHRRAGGLRARDRADRRAVLGLRRPRPRARRAHGRARARRRQRGPRLPLRPLRRAPVRRPEGAALRGRAARSAASRRSGSRRARPGPGHYVVGAAPLAPPGEWRLELVARISRLRRAPHHLHGPDRMKEAPTVRRSILAAVAVAALLAPAAAQAHVTLQPDTAPGGRLHPARRARPERARRRRHHQGRRPAAARLHRGVLRARAGLEGEAHPQQGRRADRRRRGPQERHAGVPHHLDRRRRAGRDRARRSSRTSACR